MYWALTQRIIDTDKVLHCYKIHMKNAVDKPPAQKQFLANMEEKMAMKDFTDDVFLILKKGIQYDNEAAWELVRIELVEKSKLFLFGYQLSSCFRHVIGMRRSFPFRWTGWMKISKIFYW